MDMLPSIQELCALEADWDSYGSPPPSLEVIAEALTFVQRAEHGLRYYLPEDSVTLTPSMVPLSGGGIQIEWQTPSKELELEFFEGESPAVCAVETATGCETEGILDPDNPATMCNLLAWLTAH